MPHDENQRVKEPATLIATLSARIEALDGIVRDFLRAHDEGPGLIDCIDNQGERYTSQLLDDTIQRARALATATERLHTGQLALKKWLNGELVETCAPER